MHFHYCTTVCYTMLIFALSCNFKMELFSMEFSWFLNGFTIKFEWKPVVFALENDIFALKNGICARFIRAIQFIKEFHLKPRMNRSCHWDDSIISYFVFKDILLFS